MITGSAVEVGDECSGGGEHDRVQPGGSVSNPRGEGVLGYLGEVADVHPAMIDIEPEGAQVTVAESEGGGCLGGIGEAVQFAELQSAVGVLDGAEDAAGTDGDELLIITNQRDTRPTVKGVFDGGVEGQGVGHPRLVDDDQGAPVDVDRPVG